MSYPKCPKDRQDCRFTSDGGSITDMYSPIEYDRAGKPVGGGRNYVTNGITCSACGASWTETRTELERAQGKSAEWRSVPFTHPFTRES